MIDAPDLVLIGSTGRNAGKTALACALVRGLAPQGVVALKVTSVGESAGICPRGGDGCGACALAGKEYILSCENGCGCKDTDRLRQAGAAEVYWLRSLRTALAAGFAEFRGGIPSTSRIVCESNSLRRIVRPALFVMIRDQAEPKDSARSVIDHADICVDFPWNAEFERRIIELAADRLNERRHGFGGA